MWHCDGVSTKDCWDQASLTGRGGARACPAGSSCGSHKVSEVSQGAFAEATTAVM